MEVIGKFMFLIVCMVAAMGAVVGTLKMFGAPENVVAFAAGFTAAEVWHLVKRFSKPTPDTGATS